MFVATLTAANLLLLMMSTHPAHPIFCLVGQKDRIARLNYVKFNIKTLDMFYFDSDISVPKMANHS
jgi:hypothetical protein